eukprot:2494177-Pleurochrysis_carterae.AAC.1
MFGMNYRFRCHCVYTTSLHLRDNNQDTEVANQAPPIIIYSSDASLTCTTTSYTTASTTRDLFCMSRGMWKTVVLSYYMKL